MFFLTHPFLEVDFPSQMRYSEHSWVSVPPHHLLWNEMCPGSFGQQDPGLNLCPNAYRLWEPLGIMPAVPQCPPL